MSEDNKQSQILNFLVENERITEEQRTNILKYSRDYRISVPNAISVSGIIGDPSGVIRAISEESGVPFVVLEELDIPAEILGYIDRASAIKLPAIPYDYKDGVLYIAVTIDNAKRLQVKTDLRKVSGEGAISIAVATHKDIIRSIELAYRNDGELKKLMKQTHVVEEEDAPAEEYVPPEITSENNVVKFVDLALKQAVKDKASDIHFDSQEFDLHVRYRIDGVLRNITTAPASHIPEIVSRIKILSNLDISNSRTPQDGRLEFEVDGRSVDFRVATLPAIHGEKIVLRILDNSSATLSLSQLGFSSYNLDRLLSVAHRPHGVLLVTGPTGSGKSTTLYSALNEINSPEINIITAEDPVEYELLGITQIHVKKPLTFERVLRTVLRSDPDVILIGEIRDNETAEIAMHAGMTGHLVFSTLHTNDAASALTRLEQMQVEPFITGSTVAGVVSQRLARRLCNRCKAPRTYTDIELQAVGFKWELWDDPNPPTWFEPVGCKTCSNIGYKGRLGIQEVLLVTQSLEEALIRGSKDNEINSLAIQEGMISIKDDGLLKAAKGLTTIQEVTKEVLV